MTYLHATDLFSYSLQEFNFMIILLHISVNMTFEYRVSINKCQLQNCIFNKCQLKTENKTRKKQIKEFWISIRRYLQLSNCIEMYLPHITRELYSIVTLLLFGSSLLLRKFMHGYQNMLDVLLTVYLNIFYFGASTRIWNGII